MRTTPNLRRPRRRSARGPALLLAALLGFGCAGAPAPPNSSTGRPPQAAAEATPRGASEQAEGTATGTALAAALDRALERGGWDELRIALECRTDAGFQALEIYGSGAGIWGRTRQVRLSRGELLASLASFRRLGFAALRDSYGGAGDPAPSRSPAAAAAAFRPELVCWVRLALDGAEKQVAQLAGGRQSAELARLAEELMALGAGAARDGVTAGGLADGLSKLAAGELAAEVLVLQVNHRAEDAAGGAGWLLRIEGAWATGRPYAPATGYGSERTLALAPEEVAALAARLAEERIDALPANLWADGYTDLEAAVLGHRKSLQARRFDRMDAAAQAEERARFAGVLAALAGLHERVQAEGRPAAS